MMTLNFGTFSKMTVQDGLVPIPKIRLDVINPLAEQQKAKGLIPITTESGEIMGSTQILSKMSNRRSTSPSSKKSHAISSPSW